MKKRHRRIIKKTAKTVRKAFNRAAGPVGLTTGAVTLGGLTAVAAALSPEVRQRSRELARSTIDGLRRLVGAENESPQRKPLLEHAH